MKRNRTDEIKRIPSLSTKIAKYLFIFCAFVIGVMTFFQMWLLEPMYEQSKTATVKEVAEYISSQLSSDTLTDDIYAIQQQTDTCVMVYHADTSEWNFDASNNMGCLLYRLTPTSLGALIAGAGASEDGTYLVKQKTDDAFSPMNSSSDFMNIIYTKIVENDETEAVVMVSSGISPINATLSTLKKQLIMMSLFLLFTVFVLTTIMYHEIAKPLALINEAAKKLPEGNYESNPKTNRYEEAMELNNTLADAAEDIRKADKAKRDLISNVSHDLRTPLTMISGYGEMMMDLPEEKTDENIKVIVDESKRLNTLVNDLLDLSRLQDNRIVLQQIDFDLSSLVRSQMRKYEVYQMRDGYTIEQNIADLAVVHADPKRIEQVFNNFMTNAINYGGERKHIIVSVTAADGRATVKVRDYGEGIEEKDLPNVWDRYYKVDKTHVRVANGSGIGLAICHEILELHKAQYGVESVYGEGSTFWFSFPLAETKEEQA